MNGFLLYAEYKEHFENFDTDAERIELLYAIFDYHARKEPIINYKSVKIAFSFVKKELDRQIAKYESVCDRNKQNGLKGGRPKETQKNPENPVGCLETQNNPKEPKKPNSNTNSNSKENSNTKEKEILIEENMGAEAPPSRKGKKSFIKPTLEEVSQYCNEAQLIIPPEEFYDEMESTGWLLKRGAVKDWKATIRNWNRNRVKWAKEGKSALRGQYLNKMQRVDLAFERLDEEIKLAKEKGVEIRSENLAWLSETAPKTISAIK